MKPTPSLAKIHTYKWTTQDQKMKSSKMAKTQILIGIQIKIENSLKMMMMMMTIMMNFRKFMKKHLTGVKDGSSKKANFQLQSKNVNSKNTNE
jgi:hypothetical protein